MEQSTASRRLVKSPPELWAEVSNEDSLGRRLAEFGEIRITRVEPETTVAWEGDRASGTVELAPTGWGTKVMLTATPSVAETAATPREAPVPAAAAVPEVEAPVQAAAAAATEVEVAPARIILRREPEPVRPQPAREPEPEPRRGFFARLFRRRRPAVGASPAPPEQPRPAASVPAPAAPTPDPAPATPTPELRPVPPPAPALLAPTPASGPVPPRAADPLPGTPTPAPQIEVLDPDRTVAILTDVLDDLGAAHHRPFSRD